MSNQLINMPLLSFYISPMIPFLSIKAETLDSGFW